MRDSWRLDHLIAPKRSAARAILNDRLDRIDGYPGGGGGEDRVQSSTTGSTVERAVIRRDSFTADLMQIDDDAATITSLLEAHERMLDHIIRRIDPQDRDADDNVTDVPLCFEGQRGKEGNIVWGDVTCAMPASKSGLCATHYLAWWRHRKTAGIDVSRDHEPARS